MPPSVQYGGGVGRRLQHDREPLGGARTEADTCGRRLQRGQAAGVARAQRQPRGRLALRQENRAAASVPERTAGALSVTRPLECRRAAASACGSVPRRKPAQQPGARDGGRQRGGRSGCARDGTPCPERARVEARPRRWVVGPAAAVCPLPPLPSRTRWPALRPPRPRRSSCAYAHNPPNGPTPGVECAKRHTYAGWLYQYTASNTATT